MKISAERKARFIDALGRGAPPEIAAQSIGIDRRTANRWKAVDPTFAERWRETQDSKIELVEAVLFRQAMSGDLGAICFFLKANKPEVYNRRQLDPDAPPNDGARHDDHPRVVIYLPDNRRHLPEELPD